MVKILEMFECKKNIHNKPSLEKNEKYNGLLIGYIGKPGKNY